LGAPIVCFIFLQKKICLLYRNTVTHHSAKHKAINMAFVADSAYRLASAQIHQKRSMAQLL
jgi:hypothetical protein